MNTKTKGTIRHLLTFIGGFAVARGSVEPEIITEGIGGIMSIIGLIWSFLDKNK